MPIKIAAPLNRKWNVGAEHALFHKDGSWYGVLRRFPGALFDNDGYKVFRKSSDFRKCQQLKISGTSHVHVPDGIKNIDGYRLYGEGEHPVPQVESRLNGAPSGSQNGPDLGPKRGGYRGETTWQARQHPLAKKLVSFLGEEGWKTFSGGTWRPDILMMKRTKRLLIEVKPTASKHNVITAIGQIICYRSPLEGNRRCIIAANGAIKGDLLKVMDGQGIKGLNMRKRDWQARLRLILIAAT